MATLLFDWETTGKWLPRGKVPLLHQDDRQPFPVQIGAILLDGAQTEIACINYIIQPDGWIIPEDAAKIHGIEQAKAERYGVTLRNAMRVFIELANAANVVVAHNLEFDNNITQRAMHLLGGDFDPFDGMEKRCTMQVAKKMLKIPARAPINGDPYKYPKLEECMRHFFDEELVGAHDALADVRATAKVYLHICKEFGLKP
jgi:DNA polymerase III subunit epsilon